MFLFSYKRFLITSALLLGLSMPVWAGDGGVQESSEAVSPPPGGWPRHRVESGQTLWRISKGYGIPVEELMKVNRLTDTTLMPGDVLLLPRETRPPWTPPPERTVVIEQPGEAELSLSPERLGPEPVVNPTGWLEVTLPDKTRAWVKAENLVLGSRQPREREHLITTARAFIGVPYKWGGTNPNGYDCSGFVQEVFRLAGHSVPRMADAQYEKLPKVEKEVLEPGDLVFFNTDGSGVSHVGIYSGDGKFLHASSSRGVIESALEESYYSTRYMGASRPESFEQSLTGEMSVSEQD